MNFTWLCCTKAKEGKKQKFIIIKSGSSKQNTSGRSFWNKKRRKRKIDVEPVFESLKANLRFTRMFVRVKEKVENEFGCAFMMVNLRKYTAINQNNPIKNGSDHQKTMFGTIFKLFLDSYVPDSLFFF
ncbi:transposase [Melghiribacillus thermohalophilus]|uniref:transposase n=1 Tax=Melghiribacillus thermohalophilus TaxID=1324956 RepID=UPI001404FD67